MYRWNGQHPLGVLATLWVGASRSSALEARRAHDPLPQRKATLVLDNAFVYPRPSWFGKLVAWVANFRWFLVLRRALFRVLPFVKLQSDVRDVVYLNWVVPLDAVRPLIPEGVRVVTSDGKTLLTILTYSHGHFGPSLLGPLRRLLPSPLQSNWRLYVETIFDEPPPSPVVLFIKNVFSSTLYSVGSRLFSDALPSHVAASFCHRADGNGYHTVIEGGTGSAPGFLATAVPAEQRELPEPFAPFFADWKDAVAVLCLQDAAIAHAADNDRLAQAGIDLPIDLAGVIPLATTAYQPGSLLESLEAVAEPFAFCVPAVEFKVLWERSYPVSSSVDP